VIEKCSRAGELIQREEEAIPDLETKKSGTKLGILACNQLP